ncbi:Photosynthetic apparatus regulatory protein RegA Response regulator PrrA [Candidatus Micropelagos thuwalensis]|uniref:Pyridoxal phosphate homeostasis protein n=2 Tax=Candidatus Micropelagius thuwalensis TaxID=1397666 RepID=U2WSS0_9PROT|nr:Photosynthetic apparatus regulatory protein RegA Response regulator PrrA [Candidatus Micropelagos thuwalensis]
MMTTTRPQDNQKNDSMTAPQRLMKISQDIAALSEQVNIIAVSKTFSPEAIAPVLAAGHRVFGENRVQEVAEKWPDLKASYPDVELHLIGALQSNKAAQAVALFDVIHSLDRIKLARVLAAEMKQQNRQLKILVQVNTGKEDQKSGIPPEETEEFVRTCRAELGLNIDGLMCLPPQQDVAGPHFALLQKLSQQCDAPLLSMGMSGDYEEAIKFGATHIRLGTAIFGPRTQKL